MLQIKNLSFSYAKGRELSYDCEFSLGESIILMGKSGAGKTTLLNLIAGFLRTKSGSIQWEGESWAGKDVRERPISYLMQNAEGIGHLSVEKNLNLSRANRRDIEDISHKLGIEELMEQRASELSGGQLQRVLLAQTLLQKRPIVLLDEPFKGLDLKNKQISIEVIEGFLVNGSHLLIISDHENDDIISLKARKFLI